MNEMHLITSFAAPSTRIWVKLLKSNFDTDFRCFPFSIFIAVSKGLIEVKRVQDMQEKMEDLLIDYVASQPNLEEKVTGELLLRLSEIERVCQLIRDEVGKRKAESRLGNYPLLMELFQDKPSWLYWQLTGCKKSASSVGGINVCDLGDDVDLSEVIDDGIDNDVWEELIRECKLEI